MAITLDPALVQEMRKELPTILADLKEKKAVDTSKVLNAILITVLSNDQTLVKAEARITSLETQVGHLNKRVKKLEAESYRNRVVLKNVPLHDSLRSRSATETNGQTREVVSKLFEVMGADMRTVEYIKRVPLPKNKPAHITKMSLPIIQVIFTCFNDRKEFFSKVSKLANHEKFGKVSIDPDIPPCLLPEHKMASSKAYELRRKHVKTRILVSYFKAEIVLLTKKPNSKEFTPVDPTLWNGGKVQDDDDKP